MAWCSGRWRSAGLRGWALALLAAAGCAGSRRAEACEAVCFEDDEDADLPRVVETYGWPVPPPCADPTTCPPGHACEPLPEARARCVVVDDALARPLRLDIPRALLDAREGVPVTLAWTRNGTPPPVDAVAALWLERVGPEPAVLFHETTGAASVVARLARGQYRLALHLRYADEGVAAFVHGLLRVEAEGQVTIDQRVRRVRPVLWLDGAPAGEAPPGAEAEATFHVGGHVHGITLGEGLVALRPGGHRMDLYLSRSEAASAPWPEGHVQTSVFVEPGEGVADLVVDLPTQPFDVTLVVDGAVAPSVRWEALDENGWFVASRSGVARFVGRSVRTIARYQIELEHGLHFTVPASATVGTIEVRTVEVPFDVMLDGAPADGHVTVRAHAVGESAVPKTLEGTVPEISPLRLIEGRTYVLTAEQRGSGVLGAAVSEPFEARPGTRSRLDVTTAALRVRLRDAWPLGPEEREWLELTLADDPSTGAAFTTRIESRLRWPAGTTALDTRVVPGRYEVAVIRWPGTMAGPWERSRESFGARWLGDGAELDLEAFVGRREVRLTHGGEPLLSPPAGRTFGRLAMVSYTEWHATTVPVTGPLVTLPFPGRAAVDTGTYHCEAAQGCVLPELWTTPIRGSLAPLAPPEGEP